LPIIEVASDWLAIRFQDRRYGPRFAYIHCSKVIVASAPVEPAVASRSLAPPTAVVAAPPTNALSKPAPTQPATGSTPLPAAAVRVAARSYAKPEDVDGYLEWRRDAYLVVEGQRITWNTQTRFKLGRIADVTAIPLGYELKAKGIRQPDGSLLAQEIEARPNGIALYENEMLQNFAALETVWLRTGMMFDADERGRPVPVGRILESGEDVERVRRIMGRLVPPYVNANRLRVRVVDTGIWNAAAMANGAIWVFRGLLEDTSDDELAIVLGHELAHYTHEHSRRGAKQGMWRQLAALGAEAALEAVDSPTTRDALAGVAQLSLTAWKNGYNRNLEDQADRVGLRYAFEGGFDVKHGLDMWARARDRNGEADVVSNFLFGSHSRPSDRIKNIERELALNYNDRALQ
jgi:hypothetical protein